MDIKKIDEAQIADAIDLIWTTFLQFEAPDYSEEGIKSFKDFIENRDIINTLEFWGAYDSLLLKVLLQQTRTENIFVAFLLKPSITGRELEGNCGNIFWKIVKVKLLQLILLRTLFPFTTD